MKLVSKSRRDRLSFRKIKKDWQRLKLNSCGQKFKWLNMNLMPWKDLNKFQIFVIKLE